MPHPALHRQRRFVLAWPLIHDLVQQIVVGPHQKFHLGDEFWSHPMHAIGRVSGIAFANG